MKRPCKVPVVGCFGNGKTSVTEALRACGVSKMDAELTDMPALNETGAERVLEEAMAAADIVLFILDMTHSLDDTEQKFLKDLCGRGRSGAVWFVVNKTDRAGKEARDRIGQSIEKSIQAYVEKPVIFYTSAKNALDGLWLENEALIKKSGLPVLAERLQTHLSEVRAAGGKVPQSGRAGGSGFQADQKRDDDGTGYRESSGPYFETAPDRSGDIPPEFFDGAGYFSVDNLNELSGIEGHIRFAEQLIQKYSAQAGEAAASGGKGQTASQKDWHKFREQVGQIRKKQEDKTLNLSVVGEFATGKSTFINALLGRELLVSSALQGTTAASTVIHYGKSYEIRLRCKADDAKQRYEYAEFDSMKKALEKFTTDPAAARQLKSVHVYLPAETLQGSFRIIDTPGTNVTEAWHEEVTVYTLREISDLSIVLISAEKPASGTMLHFIQKNLAGILPQCVFVVTKLDTIRPRQRKSLLDYIKVKLESELELEDAVVLPYISPMVLEDRIFRKGGMPPETEIDPALLDQSLETEKKLFAHMARQRAIAQTKKLALLIDTMYQSISAQMKGISEGYERELALLERTKQTDLESFVRKEKLRRLGSFDEKTGDIRSGAEEHLHTMAADAKRRVLDGLDEKKSLDQLKAYMDGPLGRDCSDKADEIVSEAAKYYGRIRKQLRKEMSEFGKSFEKLYTSLHILPIDMGQPQYELPAVIEVETANLGAAASYIAQELSSENKAFLGGAGAGAAIGTMILPGVGTLVGGFLGLVGGAAAAPDTDQVRENCKNKLGVQLENYYRSAGDSAAAAVERYTGQIRTCLSDEIDKYLRTYRSEVDKQIAAGKRKKASITAKIRDLEKDRDSIQNRKTRLKSVIGHLDLLGRKEK